MRTIIAGSRTTTFGQVREAMKTCPWGPTVVLSGTARGADQGGEDWAMLNGIPVESYPADWKNYGKSAGYIRNRLMATKAEALVLVWDGGSPGSRSMLELAKNFALRIHEVVTKRGEEPNDD